MNEDYKELLLALSNRRVNFLVVGAFAMGFHGYVRATGGLDLWIEPTLDNSSRTYEALRDFGASLSGITPRTFEKKGVVFQMGVPPRRVDILTHLDGLAFGSSYANGRRSKVDEIEIPLLSLDDMIRNKESTGREKDRLDAQVLRNLPRLM